MRSTLHHDEYDNLLLLLAGRKRVLLVPPHVAPLLDHHVYDEARFEYNEQSGTLSDKPHFSGRRIDNFYGLDVFREHDRERLETVAKQSLICEMVAGDTLYLPTPWAHAVVSETDEANGGDGFGLNLAINVWWKTTGQQRRELLRKVLCTLLALVLYAVSLRPQIIPWRRGADEPAVAKPTAASGTQSQKPTGKSRQKGKGKHS